MLINVSETIYVLLKTISSSNKCLFLYFLKMFEMHCIFSTFQIMFLYIYYFPDELTCAYPMTTQLPYQNQEIVDNCFR